MSKYNLQFRNGNDTSIFPTWLTLMHYHYIKYKDKNKRESSIDSLSLNYVAEDDLELPSDPHFSTTQASQARLHHHTQICNYQLLTLQDEKSCVRQTSVSETETRLVFTTSSGTARAITEKPSLGRVGTNKNLIIGRKYRLKLSLENGSGVKNSGCGSPRGP